MLNSIWLFLFLAVLALAAIIAVVVYLVRRHDESPNNREVYLAYENPDFTDLAGFHFESYPDNDVLIPGRSWLVNNNTAEIEYTIVPGKIGRLRAAPESMLDIPPDFDGAVFEASDQYEVAGTTVTQQNSPGRKATLSWSKDGFDYFFYAEDPEMNTMGGLSTDFVTLTKASNS